MSNNRAARPGRSKQTQKTTKGTQAGIVTIVEEPEEAAITSWKASLPYLLLFIVCIYCHGFVLTNDGPIWDGWYWNHWLKTRDWAPMLEYTGAQGLPTTLWLFGLFAFTPDVVVSGMIATFLCLFFESVLTYKLALKLTSLTRIEALSIAALAQALPLFNAAQDFPVIGLIFFRTLFLFATLLALKGLEQSNYKKHLLRGSALILFVICCLTNGALLVFYGGTYFVLLVHYLRLHRPSITTGARQFLLHYPDYFLLPPITWLTRVFLVPQFGWYEAYNKPTSDIANFWRNFGTFFTNLLPYHLKHSVTWTTENPGLFLAMGVLLVILFLLQKYKPIAVNNSAPTLRLAGFGLALLLLSLLPLAMVGKAFMPTPVSLHSRHCLLVTLPIAILLFSGTKWICYVYRKTFNQSSNRLFITVTTGLVLFTGAQINSHYIDERLEWLFSQSALKNISKNQLLKDSSVILLQNYSTTGLLIYTLYGAAAEFGEMSRFVTPLPPENRKFYSPTEIYFGLHLTTVIPNEYKRINPSGRQVLVNVKRVPSTTNPLSVIQRYLALRFLGTSEQFNDYLYSLTSLDLGLLREATVLKPGETPGVPSPAPGIPNSSFTNGIGMSMVQTIDGSWVGKYEVTQREYAALMGKNPSLFLDPQRPVECVSWYDAMAFCHKLTESEHGAGRLPHGLVYRLPTTSEWDLYSAGTDSTNAVLSSQETLWSTEPVGSKPANPLGLHDVFGNVWEWCLDWSDSKQLYKPSKGGSWMNSTFTLTPNPAAKTASDPIAIVAYNRLFGPVRKDYPDQAFWDRGFRCILAIPDRTEMPSK
jgi:hypothetical protein